jgi:TPR repeat protein
MKWPTLVVMAIGLIVAAGCTMRADSNKAYSDGALERMYRADLARANDGAPDAMMRIGRYHDSGLAENDGCSGAMATICRIGVVSRWLAGTVVAPDRVQAYKWYSLAGLRRHQNALAAKRSLVPEMSQSEIAEGDRLIADWLGSHRPPAHQRASDPAR